MTAADLLDQPFLAQGWVRPFVPWLQHDESIGRVGRHRVGGRLRGTGLRKDEGDLRESADCLLHGELHRLRLRQRSRGDAQRVHGDVLLIQRGQELLAEPGEAGKRKGEQNNGDGDDGQGSCHRETQERPIGPLERRDEAVFALIDPARQADCDQRRDQRQRQREGSSEREDDGECHRLEHLAFHPGEGQQRHVNQQDDRLAVEARLDHLDGRGAHRGEALLPRQQPAELALPFGEVTQAVLGDDDGAIDDQAEIERAEAHQVGADPSLPHADGRHQHGERDHQRGDQGGAEIAEQQEQHGNDQQRAFAEIARHRGDRRVDQLGAVQARS